MLSNELFHCDWPRPRDFNEDQCSFSPAMTDKECANLTTLDVPMAPDALHEEVAFPDQAHVTN